MKENYVLLAIVKRDYDFKGNDGKQIKGTNYVHFFLTADEKIESYKFKEPVCAIHEDCYDKLPRVQVEFRKYTNEKGNSEIAPSSIKVL